MNWKNLAVVAAAATGLLGASSAFANPPHWAPAYGWRAKHHHYRPRPVVIYVPAPVYYPPAPVYYAPPRPRIVVPGPVIYGQIPVSRDLRVSFGLRL